MRINKKRKVRYVCNIPLQENKCDCKIVKKDGTVLCKPDEKNYKVIACIHMMKVQI